MPAVSEQAPKVFISYAHESDTLRAAVQTLADWLGAHGCLVYTDHPYGHRPPPEGWQAWMHGRIAEAETVLVVCTPKLKARFEKTAPDSGRGATYEGAIVTQHIYDAAMRNEKFFPVLPDGGSEDDIPTALKPWWNGHRFPSGREGIRRMVFSEPPWIVSASVPAAGDGNGAHEATPHFGCHHERLAAARLEAAQARPLLTALQQGFGDRYPGVSRPGNAAAMVQWFATRESDGVQPLFFLVRRALESVPLLDDAQRQAAEEAAVALYCLAALRLVDTEVARANAQQAGGYVLYVPRSESLVCAIIATALFGGELHLKPAEPTQMFRAEYVFEVMVPAGGDQITEVFERAAYATVFASDRELPDICLESGPLTERQRARLAARIEDIKDQKRCIALIVYGLPGHEPAAGLANDYRLPVLLPSSEVTAALLGMAADRLLYELDELWRRLVMVPGRRAPQPTRPAPPGVAPMASTGQPINLTLTTGDGASVAISSGGRSAAQSGSANAAQIDHGPATGLSVLAPLLQELAQAIAELPSAKARATLTPQAQAAQAEAHKQDQPDPGIIKRALDAIKPAAAVLDNGEKIVALCNRAYQALSQYIGLPPSPLP